MLSKTVTLSMIALQLAVAGSMIAACNRSPQSTASPAVTQSAENVSVDAQGLSISFKTNPDPPRAGDNKLEVSIKQANGAPVTDATVSAVFYMPAMPSMNMPEMRSVFALAPAAEGNYRGDGQLVMSGTWNVTVNVSRGDEVIDSKKFTVIAK